MIAEFTKSGDQIFVGDFVGSCSGSSNGDYTIGWYCSKSRERMDDKNFVLLKDGVPVVWGEMTSRIYEGKVSDAGRFALHLVGKTNQSTVRLFESNGQEFGSKQFRDSLLFFDLSADGRLLFWNSRDELRCADLSTMDEVFHFQIEPRFSTTAAKLDADGTTVLLQHRDKGWYRFDQSGSFLDKEKWLLDYIQDCDGPTLYQIVGDLYMKQGVKGAQLLSEGGQPTEVVGTHACKGCNSTLTVVGVQKGAHTELKHSCGSCGDNSAFCCAAKPGSGATKGMEKEKK